MKILLTGHTGFKGSWLTLMLSNLGHELYGYGLDPIPRGIFELAELARIFKYDVRDDIRNKIKLDETVHHTQPDIIFHLAAQPIVLSSYTQVYETYSTNLSGTLNLLDSSKKSNSLRGIVVVTTDKVYFNNESRKAFEESDPLGGKDPYSSSKALADLLTQDWGSLNCQVPIAIARAGNVIGGGDMSANRLIPEIIASVEDGKIPTIRNPFSVRPWQHVMDCLNGYLSLLDYLLSGRSGAFNFGPNVGDFHTVEEVTTYVLKRYGLDEWERSSTEPTKEAKFLTINSSKAMKELKWQNKISFYDSVNLTIDWYKAARKGENMQDFTNKQIQDFFSV